MKNLKVTTPLVENYLGEISLSKEETSKEFLKVAQLNNLDLEYVHNNWELFIREIIKSLEEIKMELFERLKNSL